MDDPEDRDQAIPDEKPNQPDIPQDSDSQVVPDEILKKENDGSSER
jgi:hypothetical protein